jgi:hypothetical protein
MKIDQYLVRAARSSRQDQDNATLAVASTINGRLQ